MTRIFCFIAAVALMCVSVPAHAALRVITTTTDLADFVRAVGAEQVDVESLCEGNQDPHYVQARPSYMVKLSRADLVVAVGLELEVGWLPSLIAGARNPSIRPGAPGYLEASAAITPIDVASGADRSQGDVHPLGNPHYWLNPDNAGRVIALIAQRLASLDPEHAALFAERAKQQAQRLNADIARWQQQMAPYKGTPVVSYHRTFDYFFRRFGIDAVGYVEDRPGIPPSPSHAAQLIALMRKGNVRVLFHEQYHDRKTSDLIAGKAAAKVLELPTSVGGSAQAVNYGKLIDELVNSFVQAMKQGA